MDDDAVAALERGLASSPDRAQLVVYADALQARGDPRGELIALDLHAEDHGATPELEARRAELMAAWLGDDLARDPAIRRSYGALEVWLVGKPVTDDDALLARVFHGPATSPHRLVIEGDSERIRAALGHLAIATRPRLSQLVLRQPRLDQTLPRRIATDVIAATPNLRELELEGRVLGAFPHPGVRTLRVTGHDALTLAGPQLSLPAVESLDLAIHGPHHRYVRNQLRAAVLERLLPPTGLPALRRLDLSRNEPGGQLARHPAEHDVSLFRWLRELRCGRQLTHLRLPALRSDGDATNAQVAIDAMPAAVEVEIVRGYRASRRTLTHATARVAIAPSVPWPPADELAHHAQLDVWLPGVQAAIRIDLASAVALMTTAYDGLPPDARVAWDEVWRAIDHASDHRATLSIDVLLHALEACAEPFATHAFARQGWPTLRATIRDHRHVAPVGATVTLRRP